jgi:tetratricopeptide (TPR) repeat protein
MCNAVSEFISRGNARLEKSEYDSAIADFSEAIRLAPNHAAAYFFRGVSYFDKGEYDSAIADLSEAIRLDPKDGAAYWGCCSAGSNYAKAYLYRGSAHYKKGKFNSAIADLSVSIRLDPDDARAYLYRGRAYYRKAELDYDKDEHDRDWAYLNYNDGTYYDEDEPDYYTLAAEDFTAAVLLAPDCDEAKEALAEFKAAHEWDD